MKWLKYTGLAAPLAALAMLGAPLLNASWDNVFAQSGPRELRARLIGFNEVPAVSTVASGEFRARIDATTIQFELSYRDLEAPVTAAHIHLGQRGVVGGIMVFFCGGGGKPVCPQSGTVTGTIVAADVVGPTGQGIAAGEFEEVLRAIRAGVSYVNVHSAKFPTGEIRAQLRGDESSGEGNRD